MYKVNPSLNFKIIDKADGLHFLVTGPLPDAKTLVVELWRMNISVSPDILSQIVKLEPHNEMLIKPKEMLIEEPVPQNAIRVSIANAKMVASVCVNKDCGLPISTVDLEVELKKAGVVYGIKQEALSEALRNPGKPVPVAYGYAPVDGQDSIIVMYFHEPDKKPVLLEDGRVNYYELGHIVSVHSGDIMGVRTPPTAGDPGYNVLGELLPAKPGKDIALPVGKGITVADNKAIAEYDGALSWDKNKVSILKSITINGNVDFSVGNINFPGKVIVIGNVTEGFKVQADEDIDIRGGVDDAEVISRNGSVFVQKGIIGRGKAMIIANKNVEAKFIQEAVVEAGQNVIVNEYVLRCDIKAGNSVLIQGRKGKIMGNNNITAKTKIKAAQIQNSSGLQLVVEGIDRKQNYDRVNELNDLIRDLEKSISKLAFQIRQLKDQTSNAGSLNQLQKLLPKYFQNSTQLEAYNEERKLIAGMLKSTRGEGMIEIGSGLEQGMRLTIKNESINIKNNQGQIGMFFDPDEKRIKKFQGQ